MDEVMTTLYMVLGVLIRVGIPVGLTTLVIVALRRLDAQWQTGAEEVSRPMTVATNPGCWNIHNCSPEKRANCPAFKNQNVPCWQVHRRKDGLLNESCIGCNVFKEAPMPVAS